MNQEQIERLLIDRALGELTEESRLLLDEYLVQRPDWRFLDVQITDILCDAREVLEKSSRDVMPMPSLSSRVATAASVLSVRRSMVRRFALAASLLLVFWMGRLAAPPASTSPAHTNGEVAASTVIPVDGFWSIRTLLETRLSNTKPAAPSIRWSSPLARPQLGEQP